MSAHRSLPARPRVLVLYNCDYDDELTQLPGVEGVDESAVRKAALAVLDAVREHGLAAELRGVEGPDLAELIGALQAEPPDLVFNLCESLCGDVRNEVVMPALLDMLRIPYTGPSMLTIGLCLHKDRTKEILRARDVRTPAHVVLRELAECERAGQRVAGAGLDYPLFLKLAHEDASIGIEPTNVARDRAGLEARAVEMFARYRQPLIAERYVDGREVNVTLIGSGDDLQVLPLHEIDFAAMPADRPRIVSYAAKWDEDHVDYEGTKPVPMRNVSAGLVEAIEDTARAAYRALGLRDFGRVDLRIDRDDVPWVIDVNPNCDLSADAGVARSARVAGLEYHQLIGRICDTAWSRHCERVDISSAAGDRAAHSAAGAE